jgi:hypothetical protein
MGGRWCERSGALVGQWEESCIAGGGGRGGGSGAAAAGRLPPCACVALPPLVSIHYHCVCKVCDCHWNA